MNLQLVKFLSLFSFLSFSILFSFTPVFAESCVHEEGKFKCIEFVRNFDGDTFTADIPGVHHFFGSDIGIRIRGIDTGEIKNYSGKSECEHEMAVLAKEELASLFKRANIIELRHTKRGKYFRVLADVYINRRSVAKHMLKKFLAVEYEGGSRGNVDWCKLKEQSEKHIAASNSLESL